MLVSVDAASIIIVVCIYIFLYKKIMLAVAKLKFN